MAQYFNIIVLRYSRIMILSYHYLFIDFHGLSMIFINVHRLSYIFIDFHRFSVISDRFSSLFIDFTGPAAWGLCVAGCGGLWRPVAACGNLLRRNRRLHPGGSDACSQETWRQGWWGWGWGCWWMMERIRIRRNSHTLELRGARRIMVCCTG